MKRISVIMAICMMLFTSQMNTFGEENKSTGTITGVIKNPIIRVKEAAVYVEKAEDRRFELPRENPVIDQVNLVFVPHVLPVLVGTIVDFPNSDTVRHNVFSTPKSVNQFNLGTYDVGVVKQITFEKEGVVSLLCNVHAEMSAYVIVLQNPYFAVTDKQGKFTIRNVPPGRHRLTFWHESLKSETIEIDVIEQKTTEVEFKDLKRK